MPRRLPALACAAAVALALTACSAPTTELRDVARPSASSTTPSAPASASASASPSGSTPTPTASGSASTAEQTYLGFVSQFSPTLAATPQPTLLALGRQVCAGFEQGQDATQVSVALGASTLAPDLEATDAAVIIGAAVAQLCPQYRSALD